MADLLITVPSRGRPHVIADLWASWCEMTHGVADLLIAVDEDDPALPGYLEQRDMLAGQPLSPRWRIGRRLRLAGTLNAVAAEERLNYRMLGFWGDDNRPRTPGWDLRFVRALDEVGTGVVYGDDLLQREAFPTAVAMTSDIVETLGYFAAPGMVHLCIDLAWRDWGLAIDRLVYLPDVVIEHLHPAAGKAAWDSGYAEVNSPERNTDDAAGYFAYRDGGQLDADAAKLRALVA